MEAGFVTGSGHWQVMLTVASPTREPDSRSVPLMLASPCHLQGAAPASSLLSPDSLRTRGLTEADSDCQSVKISVLCEPCSWLCTPRVPTASSCGMCGFARRATRIPRNHFGWLQPSSSVQGPHCLSVFLGLERERGLF